MTDLLKERLQDHVVIFDGATGTEFYKRNFFVNTSYESLNLTNPKVVGDIHRSYVEAGADVVTTNSYGANRQKLARFGLAEKCVEINTAAVGLARSQCAENTLVAASLGPRGKEVASGQISFDEGVEILGEQIQALEAAGSDFLMFETLSSQIGTECAIAAVNRFGRLPFVFSFAVDRDLETVYGEPLSAILALLDRSKRRPTAVGLNCDIGPDPLLDALEKLFPLSHYPGIVQPNAGVPKSVDNRMIYMCSPEYLTTYALRYANLGARGIGGCCGITPAHIRELARTIRPGGKVVILEFSRPRNRVFRALYEFYSYKIQPRIGGLVSRDKRAYEYLPASVGEFPAPAEFLGMMEKAGFRNCRAKSQSCGIAQIYIGER